jgi:hypothetical protein
MGLLKRIKIWWDLRQAVKEFDKEVDENINMHYHRDTTSEIQEDQDVQQKYYNGITLMKRRIRDRVGGDFSSFGAAFGGQDLLALAKSESLAKKQLAEGLKQAFVYEGQDIKTPQDTTKMIDNRISDYTHLQKDKEKRELIRKLRTVTDEKEKQELLKKLSTYATNKKRLR